MIFVGSLWSVVRIEIASGGNVFMSSIAAVKMKRQVRREKRVRGVVRCSAARPRLTVFRSQKNIYVQVIDDSSGRTLVSASTAEKAVRETVANGGNVKAAAAIGKSIADRAIQKGISLVAFDRGGYRYHGRIKALADAARDAGLKF